MGHVVQSRKPCCEPVESLSAVNLLAMIATELSGSVVRWPHPLASGCACEPFRTCGEAA
jgi:hypothetical protein